MPLDGARQVVGRWHEIIGANDRTLARAVRATGLHVLLAGRRINVEVLPGRAIAEAEVLLVALGVASDAVEIPIGPLARGIDGGRLVRWIAPLVSGRLRLVRGCPGHGRRWSTLYHG